MLALPCYHFHAEWLTSYFLEQLTVRVLTTASLERWNNEFALNISVYQTIQWSSQTFISNMTVTHWLWKTGIKLCTVVLRESVITNNHSFVLICNLLCHHAVKVKVPFIRYAYHKKLCPEGNTLDQINQLYWISRSPIFMDLWCNTAHKTILKPFLHFLGKTNCQTHLWSLRELFRC